MKKIFRKNQIIITTLAIMIAAAGYLNYAGQNEVAGGDVYEAGVMDISDEDILAENQASEQYTSDLNLEEIASLDDPEDSELTGSNDNVAVDEGQDQVAGASAEGQEAAQDAAQDTGTELADSGVDTGLDSPGEAVLTSGLSVADYIANVQLSREQIRAKNKETLMGIINNTNLAEAAKQDAIQNMIKLTEISEKENAAETLLMAKGFADPVVSITDGKVDVVVNAASITDPQRAQIEDIVKRKTEVTADQIIITLLKLNE